MVSFEKFGCWWKPFEWSSTWLFQIFPGFKFLETSSKVPYNTHLFKVNNGDTRIMCQIGSQLTLKKLRWWYWPRSVAFIVVSFEHILHTSVVSIVGFEEVNIHLFKVNNGDTRIMYQICSKLTIKKPVSRYWYRSGVFIVVNFEHIPSVVPPVPLLTFKK